MRLPANRKNREAVQRTDRHFDLSVKIIAMGKARNRITFPLLVLKPTPGGGGGGGGGKRQLGEFL